MGVGAFLNFEFFETWIFSVIFFLMGDRVTFGFPMYIGTTPIQDAIVTTRIIPFLVGHPQLNLHFSRDLMTWISQNVTMGRWILNISPTWFKPNGSEWHFWIIQRFVLRHTICLRLNSSPLKIGPKGKDHRRNYHVWGILGLLVLGSICPSLSRPTVRFVTCLFRFCVVAITAAWPMHSCKHHVNVFILWRWMNVMIFTSWSGHVGNT